MINKKMLRLGSNRSSIRELFEYGKTLSKQIGADKVFDFSLGNPNAPSPPQVEESIRALLATLPARQIHGYTSAPGDLDTRNAIADNLNSRYGCALKGEYIFMTAGAAASLSAVLQSLCVNNSNVVVFAPYFPEYKVFIENACSTVKVVLPDVTFNPDLASLTSSIDENTVAVIINSPNNPTGKIYSRATLTAISGILESKEAQFGHPIYIISDEPYRELAYIDENPFALNFYRNTIICYSYSKSLSLAGERIGYIAVNPLSDDADELFYAICGSARALGYVCAPSLFQHVIRQCVNVRPDLSVYCHNRDLLYNALTRIGYDCVPPDGAFYLFVKVLEFDAQAFSDKAKELGLLLVPGDPFGVEGYVRIAYCVDTDMIVRSLPYFQKLWESYIIK